MLSSSSWTSTTWSGARPICEYCLAAPTRAEIRLGRVLDLVHQRLGLERVGEPADRTLEHLVGPDARRDHVQPRRSPAPPRRSSARAPSRRRCRGRPSTRRGRPPGRRPPSRSGRRRTRGCAASAATAFSCRWMICASCSRSYGPEAMSASLCRIPATRSRSVGGRPRRGGRRVVQLVRQPGRQRPQRQQPLALPDRRPASSAGPKNRPSSRWTAIGNQSFMNVAKSAAAST